MQIGHREKLEKRIPLCLINHVLVIHLNCLIVAVDINVGSCIRNLLFKTTIIEHNLGREFEEEYEF